MEWSSRGLATSVSHISMSLLARAYPVAEYDGLGGRDRTAEVAHVATCRRLLAWRAAPQAFCRPRAPASMSGSSIWSSRGPLLVRPVWGRPRVFERRPCAPSSTFPLLRFGLEFARARRRPCRRRFGTSCAGWRPAEGRPAAPPLRAAAPASAGTGRGAAPRRPRATFSLARDVLLSAAHVGPRDRTGSAAKNGDAGIPRAIERASTFGWSRLLTGNTAGATPRR